MSLLNVTPEIVTTAGSSLANLGNSLREAHAAAAAQTTAIAAPAADEVSAAVTSMFGNAGQEFQAVASQAAAFHDNFVSALSAGVGQYVATEAANVQQAVGSLLGSPAQSLSGALTAAANQAIAFPDQSITVPLLGNLTVSLGGSFPTPPSTGAFSGFANATNQLIGTANLTVSGQVLNGMYGPGTELQVTGASLSAPGFINFLAAGAGPFVSGTASSFNSFQTFVSQLSQGNLLGALITGINAPGNYLSAITVGSTTINLPIDTTAFGGPVGTLSIPFDGFFAQPQPITASWPTFTVQNGPITYQVDGVTGLPIGSTSGFLPFVAQSIANLFRFG